LNNINGPTESAARIRKVKFAGGFIMSLDQMRILGIDVSYKGQAGHRPAAPGREIQERGRSQHAGRL
jgi:hypothetical protein